MNDQQLQLTVEDFAQEFELHQRPAILQLAQLKKLNAIQAEQIMALTQEKEALDERVVGLENYVDEATQLIKELQVENERVKGFNDVQGEQIQQMTAEEVRLGEKIATLGDELKAVRFGIDVIKKTTL